jgi:hypothetical protein
LSSIEPWKGAILEAALNGRVAIVAMVAGNG